jgi:hypothetical protein
MGRLERELTRFLRDRAHPHLSTYLLAMAYMRRPTRPSAIFVNEASGLSIPDVEAETISIGSGFRDYELGQCPQSARPPPLVLKNCDPLFNTRPSEGRQQLSQEE